MAAQSDPALDAFDRLRVRDVVAEERDTVPAFLARFQSTAASLGPEEKIKLEVAFAHKSMEGLKAVLSDPQASKICFLRWEYRGEEDVNSIVPLLTELVLLQVGFMHHSVFNFVSSVLEHPRTKLKVLEMPPYTEGDLPRFFAALGRSQVSALTIYNDLSPKFAQGLCDYLEKDLLVKLEVRMNYEQVPSEVMMSLAKCTRLAKLEMFQCQFSQPTALANLSKSITKLEFRYCQFVGDVNWSFLVGSGVRELDFHGVKGVDGTELGGALAVHVRRKGLDKLHFYDCYFVNETLAAVGVEIGRIKRLEIEDGHLNHASVEQIALILQSPNNEMKELKLDYTGRTVRGIENHLMPALPHSNCNLNKLRFWAYLAERKAAAKALEGPFRNRCALFVLLQGQQVRRKTLCLLRRLPVEMFRLVGEVLL